MAFAAASAPSDARGLRASLKSVAIEPGRGERPRPRGTTEMINLVKIDHAFLNLDRVWCFEDRFVSD